MNHEDVPWPLAVYIGHDQFTAALMNRKAFQKSIEQRHPWITHPNGRVLPWPGQPELLSLDEEEGLYCLRIPAGSDPHPYGKAAPPRSDPNKRSIVPEPASGHDSRTMTKLAELIKRRKNAGTADSYTRHLFSEGGEKIRKKLGEEAIELILSGNKQDIVYESADLVFHLMILLEEQNLSWDTVLVELGRRMK